jgi:hypothetical protein
VTRTMLLLLCGARMDNEEGSGRLLQWPAPRLGLLVSLWRAAAWQDSDEYPPQAEGWLRPGPQQTLARARAHECTSLSLVLLHPCRSRPMLIRCPTVS